MKIFYLGGGVGFHIVATALIPKLAEQEKIIVMSSYPDIFENNPKVYRSLNMNTPYAWTDFVKKEDSEIISYDPYMNNDYLHGRIHLIESWCQGLKIDYTKDMKPELYFNKIIKDDAKRFQTENPEYIIIQFSGGQSPYNDLSQPFKYQGMIKNYPLELAQELINKIKSKHPKLTILNMALPNEEIKLEGTIQIQAPYMFYAALLEKAKTFISIDSCLNHMSAVINKKGIVLWGGNGPVNLGYDHNINLTGKCSQDDLHCYRPYIRELGDFLSSGEKWQCPEPTCMNIEPDKIMGELDVLFK